MIGLCLFISVVFGVACCVFAHVGNGAMSGLCGFVSGFSFFWLLGEGP